MLGPLIFGNFHLQSKPKSWNMTVPQPQRLETKKQAQIVLGPYSNFWESTVYHQHTQSFQKSGAQKQSPIDDDPHCRRRFRTTGSYSPWPCWKKTPGMDYFEPCSNVCICIYIYRYTYMYFVMYVNIYIYIDGCAYTCTYTCTTFICI